MRRQIIFEAESDYGRYQVIDGMYGDRPARVLYGTHDTPQSGVALDDDPELLFNYNQRFLEIMQTIQPSRVLVIGGGTLTLPMSVRQQFPDAQIDVVEIDPLLPRLARDYFDFTDDANITVTVQDGAVFMQDCSVKYDAIVVDAFSGRSVATELFTHDIVQRYKECLGPNGVVMVNFISRYFTRQQTLARTLVSTFSGGFEDVQLYPADYLEPKRHEQNIVLVAAREYQSYDYLQSVPVALMPLGV